MIEINILRAGGHYGWDPSRGGTQDRYNESVPITDLQRFPDGVPAEWSSGGDIQAICGGAVFLTGEQRGNMQRLLAVAALRESKLLLMRVDSDGNVIEAGQDRTGWHLKVRSVRAYCVAATRVACETARHRRPAYTPPERPARSGLDAAGPAA